MSDCGDDQMNKTILIEAYRDCVVSALSNINPHTIMAVAESLLLARDNNKVVFVVGNGASCATASFFVGELLKGLSYGFSRKFKAVCLTDNVPALSAFANDVSYEEAILELLKNFLNPEDVVIGISGSGNSSNIVKVLDYANSIGAVTVAMSGFDGGIIKQIAKISLHVEAYEMETVQSVHFFLLNGVRNFIANAIQEENYLKAI